MIEYFRNKHRSNKHILQTVNSDILFYNAIIVSNVQHIKSGTHFLKKHNYVQSCKKRYKESELHFFKSSHHYMLCIMSKVKNQSVSWQTHRDDAQTFEL